MGLTSTDRSDFRVTIHEADLDSLAGFVAEYPHCETGGNLFGFWTHSGAPAIQLILGPGPQARHESAAFFQDPDFMANEGDLVQRSFGLQHIGDWHSHHTLGLSQPSGGDSQTIRRTLETYGFARFMAVIATLQPAGGDNRERGRVRGVPDGIVDIKAFLFEADSNVMRHGSWIVLPGPSPIAEAARNNRIARIGATRTAQWRVTLAPTAASVAAVPIAGWYTQRWGTEFLRMFDARCRQVFDNCRMASGPNPGDLYYSFDLDGNPGTIAFPPEFPREVPVIILGGHQLQLDPYGPHLSKAELVQALVRAAITRTPAAAPADVVGSADVYESAAEVLNGLDHGSTDEA